MQAGSSSVRGDLKRSVPSFGFPVQGLLPVPWHPCSNLPKYCTPNINDDVYIHILRQLLNMILLGPSLAAYNRTPGIKTKKPRRHLIITSVQGNAKPVHRTCIRRHWESDYI